MDDRLLLEYQVLGSFISDKSTHDYIDKLNVEDFIDTTSKTVFAAIEILKARKENIDIFTINKQSKVSVTIIGKLTETVITTANIDSNVKVLKDKSNRRKLIQKANIILEMVKDTSKDIGDIKNDALKEIQELEDVVDEGVVTLSQAMLETQNLLDTRYENKDDKSYYTGLSKLDKSTAGLHKEELTTIGSRPGVGKTIIGMQIALNIARNKKRVMYTSLEMSVTQLCERIISANANVDSLRLRTGNIKDDEWINIINTSSMYALDNFLIDKTSRNQQHIRTKLRKFKPDLLIIDYLQLLQSASKEYSREREVATITRDLKLMSLEFKIPIVILSQLNRNAEGNRPSMGDLRESGAIEQDSDNIIFLHEPNEKDIEKLINEGIYSANFFKLQEQNNRKLSRIIIEKQRNGPVGTIDVVKVPKLMKFIETSKE